MGISGGSGPTFTKYMSDFKTIPSENFYPLQIRVNFSKSDYFNVYMKCPSESEQTKNEKGQSDSKSGNQSNASSQNYKPGNMSSPPQKSIRVQNERSGLGGHANSMVSAGNNSPLVLLFLHGAGFSALSWALLVKSVSASVPGCYLVAIDLRGHGNSRATNESDFSFETLSEDVCTIYDALMQHGFIPGGTEAADEADAPYYSQSGAPSSTSAVPPKVFLVGHSMGGALAAYIGAKKADTLQNIVGVCVIDVVEGSAMEALNGMKNVLQSRPKSFASEEEAIEWSLRSGYIKKRESAKVSMIGQIITQSEANKRQAAEILAAAQKGQNAQYGDDMAQRSSNRELGALLEEEDEQFDEEEEEQESGAYTGKHKKTSSGNKMTTQDSQQTNGSSSPNKQKGTPGETGAAQDVQYKKSDTIVYHKETSKSVVPRESSLKSDPRMKSETGYFGSTESNPGEVESSEGKDKEYPYCEVIYDVRGQDDVIMPVSKDGVCKSGNQVLGEKDDKKDSHKKENEGKDDGDDRIKAPERYTWRIDLFKTEPYWRSWFTGLSRNFLDCPGPKLLILAGVDRLDKELTVAQMQGKFQMLVLPKAGHAVQEDAPEKVADALASFIQRHRLAPTDSSQYQVVYPGC